MRLPIFALICLIAAAPSVASTTVDGNSLLKECQKAVKLADDGDVKYADVSDIASCTGFIHGLMAVPNTIFCIPVNVSTNQGIRVLVKYLQEHPEDLHLAKGKLALNAFADAFPCHRQSE